VTGFAVPSYEESSTDCAFQSAWTALPALKIDGAADGLKPVPTICYPQRSQVGTGFSPCAFSCTWVRESRMRYCHRIFGYLTLMDCTLARRSFIESMKVCFHLSSIDDSLINPIMCWMSPAEESR